MALGSFTRTKPYPGSIFCDPVEFLRRPKLVYHPAIKHPAPNEDPVSPQRLSPSPTGRLACQLSTLTKNKNKAILEKYDILKLKEKPVSSGRRVQTFPERQRSGMGS